MERIIRNPLFKDDPNNVLMITNSLKNFDQKLKETYDKIDYDTFIKYCEAYLNNHYTIIALGDKGPSLKFNKEDLEFLNHELDINVLSLTPQAYKNIAL